MTAGVVWHVIPDDDDCGPSKTFPRCDDGDELLARTASGDVVEVTVSRRHGCAFIGPDGEAVEADAIARRPARPYRSGTRVTEAQWRERGIVQLKVRITAEQRRRLKWIQEQDGHELSTIIGTYIDTEWDERSDERK